MKKALIKTKRTHHGSAVYSLVLIDTNKYKPHQGKKECEVRPRAIAP